MHVAQVDVSDVPWVQCSVVKLSSHNERSVDALLTKRLHRGKHKIKTLVPTQRSDPADSGAGMRRSFAAHGRGRIPAHAHTTDPWELRDLARELRTQNQPVCGADQESQHCASPADALEALREDAAVKMQQDGNAPQPPHCDDPAVSEKRKPMLSYWHVHEIRRLDRPYSGSHQQSHYVADTPEV
jgi:hypothetical protein